MTANRSLDEFAAEADDEPAEAGVDRRPAEAAEEGDTAEAGPSEVAPEPSETAAVSADDDGPPGGAATDSDGEAGAEPEPVRSTYAWSPEGGPCASCGETVEARWRQGDDLVCPDCKDW